MEVLVVMAIIAVLASITFSVFAHAREAGKRATCLSNLNQVSTAMHLYLTEFDGAYPQTRKSSEDPTTEDADGALEEPDFGSVFNRLLTYTKARAVFRCPSDGDALGQSCDTFEPDHPELDSYLYNGLFAFGLKESGVTQPAETILFTERRSQVVDSTPPYCLYLYRPWFTSGNLKAPEDDMDAIVGAISTRRHDGLSVFTFADGHAKAMAFSQTFDPPGGINLHDL